MTTAIPVLQNSHRETVCKKIRDDAALNSAYLVMNVLAAVIAGYGLFANSPAVVISGMIIAMLLWPIVGVSLALVDIDMKLLLKSLASLAAGMAGVIITAFIVGTIHKDIPITENIMFRTAPNFLDLMVALAGGAAVAYATVSPRLSVAFIGVAIATALVPPLCASGVLSACGLIHLALGALLLTFTNIVAIQFTSSVVLWLIGFRRISRTSGMSLLSFAKGNAVSIAILLALAVIFTTTLHRVVAKRLYEASTRVTLKKEITASPGSQLAEVQFDKTASGKNVIRAVLCGPVPPSPGRVAESKAKLPVPYDRSRGSYVYALCTRLSLTGTAHYTRMTNMKTPRQPRA